MITNDIKPRDWAIYGGVALSIVLVIGFFAWNSSPTTEFPVKPVWATVFTALVFGYVATELRIYWDQLRFWAIFATLLLIHAVAFWSLLKVLDRGFLLVTALVSGFEFILLCAALEQAMKRSKARGSN